MFSRMKPGLRCAVSRWILLPGFLGPRLVRDVQFMRGFRWRRGGLKWVVRGEVDDWKQTCQRVHPDLRVDAALVGVCVLVGSLIAMIGSVFPSLEFEATIGMGMAVVVQVSLATRIIVRRRTLTVAQRARR